MSAVSNRVTPRSMARWITLREVSRSVRWPKLLQPRPTAETRRPEPPRLRICMDQQSCRGRCGKVAQCRVRIRPRQGAIHVGDAMLLCGRECRRAGEKAQKKCGPGQTRRLTGTAGALDL